MTFYASFLQRFGELFRQEIECEDQEATIQVIVTLMNKCGLKELLDRVPVEERDNEKAPPPAKAPASAKAPAKRRNPAPTPVYDSPNSTNSSQSGKKLSGYNLFVKETMAEAKRCKNKKTMTDVAQEWKELSKVEQNEWKERAKEINEMVE